MRFLGQVRRFSTSFRLQKEESYRLVVVGGGSGGCATAAKFSRKLGQGAVAVIEPSEDHYYQPGWTLVGAGIKDKSWTHRHMGEVLPKKAAWIRDSVDKFDPENNRVVTKNGDVVNYDFLVVAMGIRLRYDKIKGLPAAFSTPGVCSNYSADYVEKTWEAIQNFPDGGTAVFTFPTMPIKCAGAPQKIMYLAEDNFRKRGIKADVQFFSTLAVLFGVKKYAEALWKVVKSRGDITINLEHNLVEVRPDTKEAVFVKLATGEEVVQRFDLLHVSPPMSSHPALADNTDMADQTGFLNVDKFSLRHVKYNNVFGIGDCTNVPTAKTAAAVASQLNTLRRNLSAAMEQKELPAAYDGYTSCPLVTSDKSCILAEFDFQAPPQPLETFPVDQGKERRSMFYMKSVGFPLVYWNLMLRGFWEGPKYVRKLLHLGMSK